MGNELKLSLENFQSITKGELIFHTGTTVIIGQSNSGKSATFRALKACLSNPTGSQRFIKKGFKSSSVSLEYEGNQIIWKRTPTESSYIINGETFLKTGRSNAFKIMENTGFVLDFEDTIMNIEEELQLPFPFGLNSIDLFKLYEDVFCISDSAVILKAIKSDEDKTKSEITFLDNEVNKNQNKLKELQEFKEFVDMEKLSYFKNQLENKSNRINFLKDGLPVIQKAILVQDFTVNVLSYSDKLEPYKIAIKFQKELNQLKKLNKVGKSLKEIEFPEVAGLEKYNELRELCRTQETIKKLKKVEVEILNFENKVQDYEELLNLNKTLDKIIKLDKIQVPIEEFQNKIQRYNELKSYLESLKSIKIKAKKKMEELNKAKEFVKNAEDALEQYKKEFKVCPLCHQPLK